MTDTANVTRDPERRKPGRPLVDEDLADQLLDKARAEDAELLGPSTAVAEGCTATVEVVMVTVWNGLWRPTWREACMAFRSR